MRSQSLQVIFDPNAWRGARMEPSQSPVFEWDFIIEADEL